MTNLEWFRTFIAVYRNGTISKAARELSLTQPAVSQHIAALESVWGVPLFFRTPRGMQPTQRGTILYREIFSSLDHLEKTERKQVTRTSDSGWRTFRLGTPTEYFSAFALLRLKSFQNPLVISLGESKQLYSELEEGVVDAIVAANKPTARTLGYQEIGEKRYRLIGPPRLRLPMSARSLSRLGPWLNQQPWISYSEELPITRRFWQQVFNCRFEAHLRLVVPDLRSVMEAVQNGFGFSIVPEMLCAEAIRKKQLTEVWPVGDLIPSERWHLVYRDVDSDRVELRQICAALCLGA